VTTLFAILIVVLLAILTIASYVDRLYSETGKFLSRDFQENIDTWEEKVEPRLGMSSKHAMQSAAMLAPLSLAALVLVFGAVAFRAYQAGHVILTSDIAQLVLAIVVAILLFRSFLPQLLFTRTRGRWVAPLAIVVRVLFYLVFPVTVALGFLLAIASLAERGEPPEEERPSEAVEALIEAGKEEGILEESDRALVRSAVFFGDKIVREVMTPRPDIFAVPDSLTLIEFTEQLRTYDYSRVPVYRSNLDEIVGIAFLHDLVHVSDVDAAAITVGKIARPAMFTPETKKLHTLLREMQRDKQHMALAIDEYGGLAGLITIEDALEEIVGSIADEHEAPEPEEMARSQPDGSYIVPGSFELGQLEGLFGVSVPLPSAEDYESTTLGGLIAEETGHIPAAGETVDLAGLRLEVLESTPRRVDRIRVRKVENGGSPDSEKI
jgi:CBS domain containing-hemolysin-like protein